MTTGYRWLGTRELWEKQDPDGFLLDMSVVRRPLRQMVRPRSKYIPAGPHRNCTDQNTSAMVRVRKERAYYEEMFA